MNCDSVKRARSGETTRQALLQAAISRFARESYENVGLREIAADVGLDPSLIKRYFGCKEEIFKAALRADAPLFEDREVDDLAVWLADLLMHPDKAARDADVRKLLIILNSASSTKASQLVSEACAADFIAPIAARLQGPAAELRANLVLAILVGASIHMRFTEIGSLPGTDPVLLRERLVALFREALKAPEAARMADGQGD